MNNEVEPRQLARLEEAVTLGFGGQLHRAIDQLKALQMEVQGDENKGRIMMYEISFLARMGRASDARERLRELAKLWKRTPEHQARIAVADAMLDRFENHTSKALTKLDGILEEYRSLWKSDCARDLYEETQFNRGMLLSTLGNWHLALPTLEECLAFKWPKEGEFYINLGISYFEDKQWEKGEEALKLALSEELDAGWSAAGRYYLGRIYYLRGALAKAVKEFEQALSDATAAGTSCKSIYDGLAKSCQHLGLSEEASRYALLAKSSD
jgi:tetratricopeptide (TPR) repeat protein